MEIDHLYQADSLRWLAEQPSASVDLIFADPPYNLQLKRELWRPNMTRVDAVDDDWDQFETLTSYDDFTRAWLTACRRLMSDNATIWVSGTYHNIFRVGTILQDLDFWLLNTVSWFKTNAMPNFRGTRLKNDVEFVIWAQKHAGKSYTFHHHLMKRYNDGKQLGSVWAIPACGGAERLKTADGDKLHSTQKPEALLERIIAASSNPGDLVLDPFSGTGTTAVVAKRLRRHYIGVERDAAYVQAARERVAAVEPLPAEHPLARLRVRPRRVAFRKLLEAGYLQAGQSLYLDDPATHAVITPEGKLKANGHTGSIHQLGARLKGMPSCNGWMHWYFVTPEGDRQPIDALRDRYHEAHPKT
jgi:DNA modification methylase